MTTSLRGADIVARSLERLGVERVFTLSGNHIMPVFDAALETRLDLVHVRHEAAAVFMADAWGRLTGRPGIAMVTGGPGHANAVGPLFTALGAESPMVLLSGHAALWEIGIGGFQEIAQADMARPVAKASWTSRSAATLGADIAEAMRIAVSGRPGPVHLSLPFDLLEERVEANAIFWPEQGAASVRPMPLSESMADAVLDLLARAERPMILAGPHLAHTDGRDLLRRLEAATGVPTAIIESPRGLNDATLGAFNEMLPRADLILLLGKAFDFTLRFGKPPFIDADCRFIVIDAEAALIERVAKARGAEFVASAVADTRPAAETLIARAGRTTRSLAWLEEMRAAITSRPPGWATITAKSPGRLHPAEVFRALRPIVERTPGTVLICDGGEWAQWAQSMLPTPRRLVNSVGGSIGGSIPFALAARLAEPEAPIIAIMGDGTFGFHMSEFETAARRKLHFVAILGNDGLWNAEHQIQRREYGEARMHGCEMLQPRYDHVVAALGGHGEHVERAADLLPAIERALDSGLPACVNVLIEPTAAPIVRRG